MPTWLDNKFYIYFLSYQETMSAVRNLVDTGIALGEAVKVLGIGWTSANRITREQRES